MKPLFLLALVLTACHPKPQLDDLATLPAWQMHDQTGAQLGAQDLQGRPWVANFLFTSCPTSCPPLAKATAKLQDLVRTWQPTEGRPTAQLVSFSVDPETDTPERLTEWGRTYHVDARLWKLATTAGMPAEYEAMETLVVGGFMQPLQRKDRKPGDPAPETPTPLDTAHSLRFVLVDQRGHLRRLYDADDAALAKLNADLRALAED